MPDFRYEFNMFLTSIVLFLASWDVVQIPNGEVTLAAEVHVPEGTGPFPAVVLIHGSEAGVRSTYREYAKQFAAHGIVALIYDKRGCGLSSGNYLLADFSDLASDALAAVRYLRSQSYVDTTRLGVWGISQGGWITMLTANKSSAIKFVINVSGPAVPPQQHIQYALENQLRADSFDDHTRSTILDLYRRVWQCVRHQESRDDLKRSLEKCKKNPSVLRADSLGYFVYFNSLFHESFRSKPFERMEVNPSLRSFDFDPMPLYRGLQIPILTTFGRQDRLVDVEESVRLLRGALDSSRIVIYPTAGHNLKIPRWPHVFLPSEFPSGYIEGMAEFIRSSRGP